MASFVLSFIRKVQIAKDTYSFYFSAKGGPVSGWDFKPGQYIKMTLDIKNPDARGNARFFTIASSPAEKDIMITTCLLESSFKKAFMSLKKGQEIEFRGPFGTFVLEEDARPKIFLAGGIGITPFRAMSISARDKKITTPITLFASFRTLDDMLFYDEMRSVARKLPSFQVVYTITDSRYKDKNWAGETGRIRTSLIKKYVANYKNCVYYIVGPQKMVEELKKTVEELGIQQENIKTENFPGY